MPQSQTNIWHRKDVTQDMYELMPVRTVQAKPVGSILSKRFVLMLKSVNISINCIRLASFCGTYSANPD